MILPPAISRLLIAALLLIGLGLASCQGSQRSSGDSVGMQRQTTASQLQHTPQDLDLGDDWDRGHVSSLHAARSETAQRSGRTGSTAQRPATEEPNWAIVLNTFSGEGHAEAARTMLANLGSVAPELVGRARVQSTERGSMVVYGSYADSNDARARADLDRIKSITVNNIPAFPRAFLTRVRTQAEQRQADHPYALLSVRRLHPHVHPLYTLQVAAWSDFDSGQVPMNEVRRRAEAYATELRSRGLEAYFHHDDRARISVVTVGLFDRTAFDLQTGLESTELRQLKRQFPAHLVNGEPLHELIDKHSPQRGTRVQEPRLVVVPRQ